MYIYIYMYIYLLCLPTIATNRQEDPCGEQGLTQTHHMPQPKAGRSGRTARRSGIRGPWGLRYLSVSPALARAGLSRSGRRAPRRQTTPDREHFATFPKGDSARSHPTLAAGLAPLRVPGLIYEYT